MVRIVRNVHNHRHSVRHPEASQNAYHCERCVQVVRYVLSAKNHELGYSIIINNSVVEAAFLAGSSLPQSPGITVRIFRLLNPSLEL